MKILTVDVGTGTQDIFLFDSRLDIENGFKLVLPSPTMIAYRRIQAATRAKLPIALAGQQMGGGPSAWAAEAHARAGVPTFATAEAARTLDDDLTRVSAMGIQIISEEDVRSLSAETVRIEFRDFDFEAISKAFAGFGVALAELDGVGVAVFDHGAAPPGTSDRQFRFDYLDRRIREKGSLSAFAYLAPDVPAIMSRLQAVARDGSSLSCPLVVMDTAPAAILGATFDPAVGNAEPRIIVNVGNFHTLAFRLGGASIDGVFEHHTGEIDLPKLEHFVRALADGSLTHQDIFDDMGHGALVYAPVPHEFGHGPYDIVVTGPRRSLFRRPSSPALTGPALPPLRPYFAVPFGDMMIGGCFGLLAATADLLPSGAEEIRNSMHKTAGSATAPWDLD
jgi:uncharacterized protein (DUF1786 family)